MRAFQLTHSIAIFLLMIGLARSQSLLEPTRFTIAGAPAFFNPRADYGRNVGSGFGGGGALLYRLDQPGLLSLRFDVSGIAYGHEEKQVPFVRKHWRASPRESDDDELSPGAESRTRAGTASRPRTSLSKHRFKPAFL